MNKRFGIFRFSFAIALTAALGTLAWAAAQSAPAAKSTVKAANGKAWTVPHLPDGEPDLQGIWSNATVTPLERPKELGNKQYFTEKEAAEFAKMMVQRNNADNRPDDKVADVALAYNDTWYDRGNKTVPTLRTSLIIDPPDGQIPALTPEAQKRRAALAASRQGRGPADSYEDRNNGERCITRGAPKLPSAYNNNFQIIQSPGYVAILQEMIHETRIILLDGRPHVGSNIHEYLGDSRGHWEGNTLVVDTTNYKDQVMFNNINCCGADGSTLRVVERFTRTGPDSIDYQYTVEDPSTFAKPWTVSVPLTAAEGPIYEYDCHEGNYGMSNLLQGTRVEERKSASAVSH
jgi:hypothetical protein